MKPWKQVVKPHRDVLEGAFTQSDFAVDLMKVVNGEAPAEYQDARLFFERTFVTQGIAESRKRVKGREDLCAILKRHARSATVGSLLLPVATTLHLRAPLSVGYARAWWPRAINLCL